MRLWSSVLGLSVASCVAFLACGGSTLDVGSADGGGRAPEGGAGNEGGTVSSGSADGGAYQAPSCPTQPWGPTVPIQTEGDCLARMVGSWAFCGGGNQNGPLAQFWNGSQGIQFTEGGTSALRYALLRADGSGHLKPSAASADLGSFQYDYGPDAESYGIDAGGIACMYTWQGDTTAQTEFFEAYLFQDGLLYVYDPFGGDYEFLPSGP